MIDQFTKEEFESALPVHRRTGERLWQYAKVIQGEHAYTIRVARGIKIMVRSSVKASTGRSAENGDDSIRAWLIGDDGRPLGSKVNRWTNRRPGWEQRMTEVLRTLWGWARKAGYCPKCKKPKAILKVKKEGKNKGRVFAKCWEHNGFTWLT